MLKDEHEVGGVKLSVEVMEEEEEPPLDTIMIEGITDEIDEDTLEIYFENTKKSGGEDINNVEIHGTKGYVTFSDPQGNLILLYSYGNTYL